MFDFMIFYCSVASSERCLPNILIPIIIHVLLANLLVYLSRDSAHSVETVLQFVTTSNSPLVMSGYSHCHSKKTGPESELKISPSHTIPNRDLIQP
jgi:hypothetical protein